MSRVIGKSTLRKRAAALILIVVGLACGAVSAQTVTYRTKMDGASEAPSNSSLGTGSVRAIFDASANTMRLIVNYSGLTGNATVAHIHCCTLNPLAATAGVATQTPTFTGFPSGNTFGNYDNTFDMTANGSYNAAFITSNGGTTASALAALLAGIATGRAYFNLHSSSFGGGEIRGFLALEPSLDLDASSTQTQFHAFTDGLIMLRYMLNITGPALVNGAFGPTATRTDPALIKTFLDNTKLAYDVDGNGTVDAATDGILIMRHLIGMKDAELVDGALGAGATRTSATDVAAYIATLKP
jgi:CHRD domain